MKYTNLFIEIKFFLTCSKKNYVNGDFDYREINQFKSCIPGLNSGDYYPLWTSENQQKYFPDFLLNCG